MKKRISRGARAYNPHKANDKASSGLRYRKNIARILAKLGAEELGRLAEYAGKAATGSGISIPLHIFSRGIFTANEAVIKHLHENLGMGFTEIAKRTSRSPKTVWQLYKNSQKRSKARLPEGASFVAIPLEKLDDRRLSTLEMISVFLHDEIGMSFAAIAARLKRDYQTVWTSYRRAKGKHEKRK